MCGAMSGWRRPLRADAVTEMGSNDESAGWCPVSGAYTSDGRRRSSMTHATRGHECELCGRVVFGNGGEVSHGRRHVRRGEAVELVKHYETYPPMSNRVFLAPDDERRAFFTGRGYGEERAR